MDHHILNQGRWQHHDAPVEAQGAVGGATAPALALVANQDFRCFQTAPSVSATSPLPAADRNSARRAIPLSNDLSDSVVTISFVQAATGTMDSEAPLVEPDRCRRYVSSFNDQTDVATEIGQCFSADEAFRRNPEGRVRVSCRRIQGALLVTMASSFDPGVSDRVRRRGHALASMVTCTVFRRRWLRWTS